MPAPGRPADLHEISQKACLLEGLTQLLSVTPGDFAVILHSDPDCANLVWRDFRAVDPTRFFCTNLEERDILSGSGVALLEQAIREVDGETSPAAIYVIGSCVSSLLADDVEQIAARLAPTVRARIVPIAMEAFRLYGQASILDLFSWLMWSAAGSKASALPPASASSRASSSRRVRPCVNMLGFAPDAGESERILGAMGADVNALPAFGDPPDLWAGLGKADLNVTADARLFARVLADMQERLAIPCLTVDPPFGTTATAAMWKRIADELHLGPRTTGVIDRASLGAREACADGRARLAGARIGYHLAGRKDFSLPVVVREGLAPLGFFLDLGLDVVLLYQGSDEGRAGDRLRSTFASLGVDRPLHALPDRVSLTRALADLGIDMVYCSDSLREEVARAGVPLLPIGPIEPGFDGFVRTAGRILGMAGTRRPRP